MLHDIIRMSKISSIFCLHSETGNLFRIIVDASLLLVLDNLEIGCPFLLTTETERLSWTKLNNQIKSSKTFIKISRVTTYANRRVIVSLSIFSYVSLVSVCLQFHTTQ